MAHIRNPVEWAVDQLKLTGHNIEEVGHYVGGSDEIRDLSPPVVGRVQLSDLKQVLVRGLDDFMACRTDVILLCLIYPVLGLVLSRLVFGYEMLPLLFPLASGFALIGPVAAMGFYEMSRRREQGRTVGWGDAFGVAASPRFGAILLLALLLLVIFLVWLAAAYAIYAITLGPEPPLSAISFLREVFTTPLGWVLIGLGTAVGFLFALLVLAISVISFPLLLDRDAGLPTAIVTSVRAVIANPVSMLVWGLLVAAGLVIGSVPAFLGLAIVVPILGHATWHLYRKVVA